MNWTTEAPTKPGMYWFYGDESVGNMGMHYDDDFIPKYEMMLVKASKIVNGMMFVTKGRFMPTEKFDKEKRVTGHVGMWAKAALPDPPTEMCPKV